MSTVQLSAREQDERRKKTRKVLMAFLKRLRKVGRTFRQANDWYEFVKQLQQILGDYGQNLPPHEAARLQKAMQLTDTSRNGIGQATRILEFEVEKVVELLPASGIAAPIVIAALIVAAIAGGVAVSRATNNNAQITIANQSCDPIPLAKGMLPVLDMVLGTMGMELPNQPIDPGTEANLAFPAVALEVDGTQADAFSLRILGVPVPLPKLGNVTAIEFDGQPLRGCRTTLRLTERSQHRLVITCR